ncbi:MAG: 4-hydroxy-tetrahydrodipicolinate reductase [Alphaproteobacteria bacterium]
MKIGVTGCLGRVGSLLVAEILSGTWQDVELAGGTVLTQDLGKKQSFFTTDKADDLFVKSHAVIDFTTPPASREHIRLAARHHKTYVLGTTGMSAMDEKEIRDAALETRIVYAANMSVGVNLLLALAERAAASLGADEWDIEIFESHHKNKIDAPSGTALALGKSLGRGRGVELDKAADYARHGETGAREKGKIGFSVARGGDVVGDHTVYFYGEGERIELTHRATNRALFAKGAIRAALWAHKQKNGLYSIRDMLGV